jgi:hypothetical protein
VILVFRLLSWTEKYQTPYPKLLAVAGTLAAGLIWALLIVSAYVSRDRTCFKR